MAQSTTENIQSLEMFFEPIANRDIGAACAYRSQLRVNSPDLGVLLPSVYLPVAERTLQATKLSAYALRQTAEAVSYFNQKEIYFNWVSAYIPIRFLLSDGFFENILSLTEEFSIKPAQMCLELSGELLYGDPADFDVIGRLRNAGFIIMLADCGDDFCPVMQIDKFMPDFAILNPSVTKRLCSENEKSVTSAYSFIEMIDELKVIPVAAVVNNAKIEAALPDNLSLYCGKLAGKTKKLRNIRA